MWAVDVQADDSHEAVTVMVMARNVHGALDEVRRRHPALIEGRKGKAALCDCAVHYRDSNRFECVRLRCF